MTEPYVTEGTWISEDVGEHTCGTAKDGHYGAHQPGCGLEPLVEAARPEGAIAIVQMLNGLTAERERARAWAVALEQELAEAHAEIQRLRPTVPPGPCWADSGVIWPGRVATTRCDLRAGHAGAHEADRGDLGGHAVWTDSEAL